jgi:hypothetical protein
MTADKRSDIGNAVIELLRGQPKKACFITEVRAALGPLQVDADAMERALSELEARGAVIIRAHYCADPHLDGVDLRIIALINQDGADDAQANAIGEIDKAWDRWLAGYLSNHRCS